MEVGLRPSRLGGRSGVALVITLIMLSIITFMAVTFLVLSQRERRSVSTALDQKVARDASDAAFSRVSAELLTHMMVRTNFQDFDLMVSTNYINYLGLQGGSPGSLSPTNVNYDYLTGPGHNAITDPQDREINIASLLYNPRPPVYVVTNAGTGQAEFRFYLDLNRNGRFDTNGDWPEMSWDTKNPYFNATNGSLEPITFNGPIRTNRFVGDPEWIGVLERPWEMHSADNRFIARYAYLVIPAGKTLDVNYIHNRAKRPKSTLDGFLRNQGVGSWEINLAGLLADLNTNIWWNQTSGNPAPYFYDQINANFSTGLAFVNANDILGYRYGNLAMNLTQLPASAVLQGPAAALTAKFAAYNVDWYSDGPLMLGATTNIGALSDNSAIAWSGSENTNHVFSAQDLFSQMPVSFRTNLLNVGTSNDSYNAYTFYRLLSQLGSDSAPEQNKLNINFKNTDIHGTILSGMETNGIAWGPSDFFTNAANRILGQLTNNLGVALSTAYIPLYPTNYYTPSVHRALQLAANIFDATTNRVLISGQTNAFFPSVFRPIFMSQNGKVWINGFVEVTNTIPLRLFPYYSMDLASNSPGPLAGVNIYGVPWVIGAKKDFPNFNEYAMETAISFNRKLKLFKSLPGANPITAVKQLFEVGISNTIAIEAFNSYGSSYPRDLMMSASNEVTIGVINQFNTSLIPANWRSSLLFQNAQTVPGNTWPRFVDQSHDNSIMVPLQGNVTFFTNAMYINVPNVQFLPNDPAIFVYDASNAMPELYLTTTNRVQFSLVDTAADRVVDFVNFEDISTLNISEAARHATQCGLPGSDRYAYWCTNAWSGAAYTPKVKLNKGINYQIGVSEGVPGLTSDQWAGAGGDPDKIFQINDFRNWLNGNDDTDTNLTWQTPFNPTVHIFKHTSWQVNDPLVHYTIGDLTDPAKTVVDNVEANPVLDNIGHVNTRYRPWGGYTLNADPKTDYNIALKDPGVNQSSAWDFPTNKFPNLGWLGRVHRGTPWQTVYMKSPLIDTNSWTLWSGNTAVETNGNIDSLLTVPVKDYPLFDLFTATINGNATRGQLSVNQTNLAAWTAVFAGVNVITNSQTGVTGPAVISPAGVYDINNPTPVARIWKAINDARANTNLNFMIFPNHVFNHVGDVLAAPQLTVASPYLNTNSLYTLNAGGVNDEIMERIPQQIMSLLTLNQSPRFVIYSFGQTLHPADHALVTGGTFNGLCTNYQITAESATRAVVRVEGTSDPKFVNGKVDSLGRSYPPHVVVEQFNVLGPD